VLATCLIDSLIRPFSGGDTFLDGSRLEVERPILLQAVVYLIIMACFELFFVNFMEACRFGSVAMQFSFSAVLHYVSYGFSPDLNVIFVGSKFRLLTW
jgi:hypothetical protein